MCFWKFHRQDDQRPVPFREGGFSTTAFYACCSGKPCFYLAGVTIPAAFEESNRSRTDNAVLVAHERRSKEMIELSIPIKACIQIAEEATPNIRVGGDRMRNEVPVV